MSRTYQRTPDGRVILKRDELHNSSFEHNWKSQLNDFQPFLQSCQSILSEDKLTDNAYVGYFIFVLGAADHFWERFNIDEQRFPAFVESLLELLNISASVSTSLTHSLSNLSQQPKALEVLLEGAETMNLWLDGDHNSVMRLNQLLQQWQYNNELLDIKLTAKEH